MRLVMTFLALSAVLLGLVALVWSAGKFVTACIALARQMRVPALLVGIIVVGFGTSAPEILVAVVSGLEQRPQLGIGSALGSNIANIGLVLGCAALLGAIEVPRPVWRRDMGALLLATGLAAALVADGAFSRWNALVLLVAFGGILAWQIRTQESATGDVATPTPAPRRALWQAVLMLVLLIASARLLVWGAVLLAQALHIGDDIIGLTIVAIGTSLPELAATVAAMRRRLGALVLGNVIGSNLMNTLIAMPLAALVHPHQTTPHLLSRDLLAVGLVTTLMLAMSWRWHGTRALRWPHGALLLACYLLYLLYLGTTAQ